MSTCHAATLSRKTGRAFAAHRCCKQTSIRTNAVLKRQPTVTARHQHASRGLPQVSLSCGSHRGNRPTLYDLPQSRCMVQLQEGASRSPLATTQTLKAQLLHVVTRYVASLRGLLHAVRSPVQPHDCVPLTRTNTVLLMENLSRVASG